MTVPLWLVRAITGPGGHRLPERKHLEPPKPAYSGYDYSRGGYSGGYRNYSNDYMKMEKENKKGWLPEGDYRLWSGSKWSNFSQCRCCRTVFYRAEDRKKHMQDRDCGSRLIECYKGMLRDGNCVMCDGRTSKRKWGVPLCGEGCVQEWRTGLSTSVTFELVKLERIHTQLERIKELKVDVDAVQRELRDDAKTIYGMGD